MTLDGQRTTDDGPTTATTAYRGLNNSNNAVNGGI